MNKSICLPILSFKTLFYLKLFTSYNTDIIYYELMPRYMRGLTRFVKIPNHKICSFINIIFNFKLIKIQHGDDVKDYSNIRMNVYIKIADISEKYIPKIKNDYYYKLLSDLVHESVSSSTIIKLLAHKQLHFQLLSAKLCLKENQDVFNSIAIYNSNNWSAELLKILTQDDFFKNIKFINPPFIFDLLNRLNKLFNLATIQLKYLFKRGVSFNKINKKSFNVASEIFDLKMLQGRHIDTNFFIDNKNFKVSNSIFYITEKHSNILKQNGYNSKNITDIAKSKKINIINLNNLRIPVDSILNRFKWSLKVCISSFSNNSTLIYNLLPDILNEQIDYETLFHHFEIQNHIHFINPNGRAPLLLNSSTITGLCRQNNVRSCGIQNRIIDAREYEFCFDNYDVYFSWGQSWIDTLGSALCFVKEVVIVGTFNLSEEIFNLKRKLELKKVVKNNNKQVLIFPSDVYINTSSFSGGFYSLSYNINFLKSCLILAASYPNIIFYYKIKHPYHLEVSENTEEFKKLNLQNYNNFVILNNPLSDYFDKLLVSDLVISIGFTSPGVDALLLNIKSIYFSQLFNAGKAFKVIPNFVSESTEELIYTFDKLIKNDTQINTNNLKLIDPYRDGKSIKRIINYLKQPFN